MENSDSSKSALEKWRERKKKESSKTEPVKRIKKLETSEPSTLSHGQERLWLLEQLYPNQSLYTYAHRYSIEGKANIELLKKSLEKVIERHEILRTIYEELNGQIVQVIKDNFELQVDDHALNQSDDAEEVIQSFVSRPFDLATDIPIRLLIIKRTDSVDFIVALHHIAGDAWSINIVNSEMSIIYKALSRNEQPLLPNLTLQYRDFASWQKHKSINQQHLDYWKHKLGGELESLDLPKSKTSLGSFEGKTFSSVLDEGTSLAVADLSTKLKVTPFSLLLTAFHILLGKYSDSFDQIVGTPISNRDFPELEKIIGFFNETYAIRGNLSRNESFKSAACTMSQTILMALAHREITFDILVNEIQPERAVGKNPLFQAMFLYIEAPTKLSLGEEISIHEEVLETRASKFDLTLFVNKKSDLLELTFEYSADIEVSFIERMATHFRTLLKAIITNPKAPISRLPILSLEEFGHMTGEKNRPELDILKRESIQSFIKQRSIQNPSSIAISTATKDVSYAALDQWSNQLASVLVASGLRENEFVGLFTSRSVEMIVGILGILKAGGAYLPLDPDYPKDRIDFMLSDSGCNHILYQQETAQRLDQNQMDTILIDCEALGSVTSNNPLPNKNQIDDFAYLIYTSGSTGKPKGVPITHRQLIHSTVARMEFYHEELTAFLLLSSYSFDSSIAGIFWTLCTGGRLVLPKERIEQDVNQLSSLINRYSISHTLLLPSLYQVILSLVDSQNLQSLKVVIVAGEACPSSMITSHFRLLPDTSLYNEYGPTEATVWCIAHKVEPTDKDHSVPIGKPIINTISYVLDEDMNPLPTGMIGELYIGGMGVANGYLNRPELTVEKFLKNPFQPEGYIYKTGDKVRYNKDGNIEFVGRSDEQVKLRGFRIELHEIKEVLISLQAVSDAFIEISVLEEEKQLLAYIVSTENEKDAIIQQLKGKLPRHMIPKLIILEDLPKLPNGKLDRSKLPDIPSINFDTTAYEAPETALEKTLTEIWKDVLKLKTISVNSNFFEIGGDSIRSIQIVSKARLKEIQLESTALFRYQSIRELAEHLQDKAINLSLNKGWVSTVPMKVSGKKAPLFCLHSGGAHVMFYRDLALNIQADHPVYAIQPKGLEADQEYDESIPEMASNYIEEIKKIQPKGSYHLLGTCFSNAVGLEMLHQLRKAGDQVAIFFIIDSAPAFLNPPSPNGEKMPVKRFFKLALNGDFDVIKKKLRNRYIRFNKKVKASSTSQVEKDLDEMIESLNTLYARYTWRPIKENFVLIRSSEFAERKSKQFHINHWLQLSQNNLQIIETHGHHLTLFRQPEVLGLARVITSKLNELSS